MHLFIQSIIIIETYNVVSIVLVLRARGLHDLLITICVRNLPRERGKGNVKVSWDVFTNYIFWDVFTNYISLFKYPLKSFTRCEWLQCEGEVFLVEKWSVFMWTVPRLCMWPRQISHIINWERQTSRVTVCVFTWKTDSRQPWIRVKFNY